MKATNWDLMRLASALDGDFCLSDFTAEEIDELLGYISDGDSAEEIRRKYFEYYDDIKDRVQEKHKWSD